MIIQVISCGDSHFGAYGTCITVLLQSSYCLLGGEDSRMYCWHLILETYCGLES